MDSAISANLDNCDAYLKLLDASSPLFEFQIHSVLHLVLIIVVTAALWHLSFRPFNSYKDITGNGYDSPLKSNSEYGEVTTKNVVKELQQQRDMGEVPPVFPNGWFMILEAEKLGREKAMEINALGLNLVAWRGKSGISYIAEVCCSQLGTAGKVYGETVTCPHHGWEFHGPSGSISKSSDSTSTQPESKKFKARRILERNAFIYIWYHSEGEDPTWLPDIIPEIANQEWSYRGKSVFRVNCHMQADFNDDKELPENGADAVHFGLVHKLPMLPESPIRGWNWSIEHSLAGKWTPCEEEGRKHTANIHVTHHVTMFNIVRFGYLDFFATQIGPGISHIFFENPFGRGVIIQNVTPLGPVHQLLTQRFYTSATFITPGVKVIMTGQATMISRDITIWNRKTYKKNPPLAKEDNALKRFRIWYSQFYSENSPRYFSKNDAIDNSLIALRISSSVKRYGSVILIFIAGAVKFPDQFDVYQQDISQIVSSPV